MKVHGIYTNNILSFIVVIIIGEIYTYKKNQSNADCNNLVSIIILAVLTLIFAIFTFAPHILDCLKIQ